MKFYGRYISKEYNCIIRVKIGSVYGLKTKDIIMNMHLKISQPIH